MRETKNIQGNHKKPLKLIDIFGKFVESVAKVIIRFIIQLCHFESKH